MLYKKNCTPSLSNDLFKNPTAEYRGTPFWAWNSLLTSEELCRQIDIFNEMGLGGFHMHVRTGLENQYLDDDYLKLVRDCVEKAKSNNMLAWLYDEDRWPSGAAGGIVTKEEKFRSRFLLFTPFLEGEIYTDTDSRAAGGRSGNGKLLACYDVVLDSDGFLDSYSLIGKDDEAKGTKWYAFLDICAPSSWYNDQTYVDTLNPEAIKKFVEVTHEKYKNAVGDEFDKTIPAIFTDEPQFSRKKVLENSFDKKDITMPWTDKVPELYEELYGCNIFDTLPEVFWDLPGSAPSVARYRYHDMIAELFARSFADVVGGWCSENNIYLSGHLMEEPTLHSQTAALGEAMRSYRSFGMPGIDMLCNRYEYTTAKQAQSATHQFGYEGVLSELYGVTGWDCDFRTYKYQGDWQAALGVTVRVPHLSWYAMKGEAKRDYPASIHYQSPWYKEYSAVEDHFARVNTAMTRGTPIVKVGVIHPVESFWLHWGPNDKSELLRNSLNDSFENVSRWLLEGSIDFDFISESLFPTLCNNYSAPLKVGKMHYDAILVPGCETLRSTTFDILDSFASNGGKVIIMGGVPSLCDAVVSSRGKKLAESSQVIDFSRSSMLNALDDYRSVTIRYSDGRLTNNCIYQLRKDNDCNWLFIAHSNEPNNKDVDKGDNIQIILNGEYSVELYDTQSGDVSFVPAEYLYGKTIIRTKFYGYDSLLFRLIDGKNECDVNPICDCSFEGMVIGKVDYELDEKNVFLLDMAEYKLDSDSEYSSKEEILRLDNICRERMGLRERNGGIVQPYVYGKVKSENEISLRFTFTSEIDYKGAELALEDAEIAKISFNGIKVENNILGDYVDISIGRVSLPDIKKGINVLDITLPFGPASNTENMFILGDFGVRIEGSEAVITSKPEKIPFGDLTKLGFPFYGGNITYKFTFTSDDNIKIRASQYRGALIDVKVDNREIGKIIYPPYIVNADNLESGEHSIQLKLFIHRYNTFGPLHLVDVKESWHGPGAWRSSGSNWSYEYNLRPTGILIAPAVK